MIRFWLCGACTVFVLLVPAVTSAATDAQRDVLLQQIAQLQTLIVELEDMIAARRAETVVDVSFATPFVSRYLADQDSVVARYQLQGGSVTVGEASHARYVRALRDISPSDYEVRLSEFVVFRSDGDTLDAFVETIPPQHTAWRFAVAEELITSSKIDTELIVHELAHIISYDPVGGGASQYTDTCHRYFSDNCPPANSYLALFVDTFWSDAALDRVASYQRYEDPLRAALAAYDSGNMQETFVSDYASIAPEEDFAESFMMYVIDEPVPRDTLAEQKVGWFDRFPHLRRVAHEIEWSL